MKKNLFFYLIITLIVFIQMLISYLIIEKYDYNLTLYNLNQYKDIKLLYPEKINFKPKNVEDIINKYKTSQYNFYFYLDRTFLEIENDKLCLKLKTLN